MVNIFCDNLNHPLYFQSTNGQKKGSAAEMMIVMDYTRLSLVLGVMVGQTHLLKSAKNIAEKEGGCL